MGRVRIVVHKEIALSEGLEVTMLLTVDQWRDRKAAFFLTEWILCPGASWLLVLAVSIEPLCAIFLF